MPYNSNNNKNNLNNSNNNNNNNNNNNSAATTLKTTTAVATAVTITTTTSTATATAATRTATITAQKQLTKHSILLCTTCHLYSHDCVQSTSSSSPPFLHCTGQDSDTCISMICIKNRLSSVCVGDRHCVPLKLDDITMLR